MGVGVEGRKGQESAAARGGGIYFKFCTWYQQAARVKNRYPLALQTLHLCANAHEIRRMDRWV